MEQQMMNGGAPAPAPIPNTYEQGKQLTGTVKFFSQKKGYGFITQPDGSEIFVHTKEVQGQPLQTNDQVAYSVGTDSTTGRPSACGVTGGTGQPFNAMGFQKGGFGKGMGGFGGKGFNPMMGGKGFNPMMGGGKNFGGKGFNPMMGGMGAPMGGMGAPMMGGNPMMGMPQQPMMGMQQY